MAIKLLYYPLYLALLLLIACNNQGQNNLTSNEGSINNYQLARNWPGLPDGFKLGNPTGIGIDTHQNIFIFHRADRVWPLLGSMPHTYISSKTILMLDRKSGKILNSWGDNLFIMPHGLTVDKNNNVWVTDVGLHQVFKFDHEGKLLMKLGEAKVSGNDKTHFNRPTDVAVAKNGSFYVSDGYGNSRIIWFSSDGKYLFGWGKKGAKEGEFNIPHSIDLDVDGKIYVADRENSRVQVFDSAGKFLKQFSNKNFGNICSVTIDKSNNGFYATDDLTFLKIKHRGSDIFVVDTAGNVKICFGRSSSDNGQVRWYHDIAVDNQQSIYAGDILDNKVQKFNKVSLIQKKYNGNK